MNHRNMRKWISHCRLCGRVAYYRYRAAAWCGEEKPEQAAGMGRYDFTYGTSLHVILKREKDYVQTGWYKDDKAALKKAIIRMLEWPCVEACYYCDGDGKVADKLEVVPAGEQCSRSEARACLQEMKQAESQGMMQRRSVREWQNISPYWSPYQYIRNSDMPMLYFAVCRFFWRHRFIMEICCLVNLVK